jgi:hypothetical protein
VTARYDYSDPGSDPDYCDGLSDPPERCAYCSTDLVDPIYDPYCGSACAAEATSDDDGGDQ